jgi:hypothetical protein
MKSINLKILDDLKASAFEDAKAHAQIEEHLEIEIEPHREKIHKALMSLDRSKMSGEPVKAAEYNKFQNALSAAERKAEVCRDALETLGARIPKKRAEEAVQEISDKSREQRKFNEERRAEFLKALPHLANFLAWRESFGDYAFNLDDFRWLKDYGCPVFFEDRQVIIDAVSDAKKKLKIEPKNGPAMRLRKATSRIRKLQNELPGRNPQEVLAKAVLEARAALKREEKASGKNTDTDK